VKTLFIKQLFLVLMASTEPKAVEQQFNGHLSLKQADKSVVGAKKQRAG
jgi:hypothetical protein